MPDRKPVVLMPHNCAVREHTADGVPVGRCWHYAPDSRCPRHGDVRQVQIDYLRTGRLTHDYDLPSQEKRHA